MFYRSRLLLSSVIVKEAGRSYKNICRLGKIRVPRCFFLKILRANPVHINDYKCTEQGEPDVKSHEAVTGMSVRLVTILVTISATLATMMTPDHEALSMHETWPLRVSLQPSAYLTPSGHAHRVSSHVRSHPAFG